jgi:dolichol-phosphate mannosyltransferase
MHKISYVIPVFNEEDNLARLLSELQAVTQKMDHSYEVLFIDDGSSDGSLEVIKSLARRNPEVKYLAFARNCGQSAALYAGFQAAKGEIIVTLMKGVEAIFQGEFWASRCHWTEKASCFRRDREVDREPSRR